METEPFFAALGSRLAEAREADRRRHERFFSELAPRLDAARSLDRELDRQLARRFNVFNYLRTDELGLSRVIADLLDSGAAHGQGTLFLRALLEGLNQFRRWPDLDACRSSAVVEHRTPSGRKIDVVVRVVASDQETWCLATENKPYAGDQESQVRDYLEYLEKEFGERFLLLYLPPTGEGPSEWSVDPKELDERWKGRFGIVPYRAGENERSDEFDAFRFPFSLTDWLAECRERCEVDRLRWFLRDAELYCQRIFGDRIMTTDSESRTVREFVMRSHSNLKVAQAVYESWPVIRDEVCERFFKRLKKRIEDRMKESTDGIRVGCEYRTAYALWLYRDCWTERGEGYYGIRRRAILMESYKKKGNWYIGIWNSGNKRPNLLQNTLARKLGEEEFEENFPWYEWMDEDKSSWSVLVPDLHEECGMEDGGEITNYFVDRFIEVATEAIPVIDELEGTET